MYEQTVEAQRALEKSLFDEYVSFIEAVKVTYSLNLTIRRIRLENGVYGLVAWKMNEYIKEQNKTAGDFSEVQFIFSEDCRGLEMIGPRKGTLVSVAKRLQKFAETEGFTFTL